ncbi:DUF6415 family natural product biosynthesis protein [Streptomyces sp. ME19-01-6]|uniref:DUF6415 family natural product biosynthesis protein n=1 Tax=Streptomyces sp. ME19-01-6 TaxID=3028686 RepID=UPI0029B2984C|nr:DUF6415 family natural product biosynthesis protein [Streptomyces sp. ME19-01-6]MDX3224553.1 DUF6415 family natural product biosynthesis protein [Streptomyces sp. ME19-01-6]
MSNFDGHAFCVVSWNVERIGGGPDGSDERWHLAEDLTSVLECWAPEDSETGELARRLSGSLAQLVSIALAGYADQEDHEIAVLVERAHTVRSEEKPCASWMAIGHLRRLEWLTHELLERLTTTGHLKDAA